MHHSWVVDLGRLAVHLADCEYPLHIGTNANRFGAAGVLPTRIDEALATIGRSRAHELTVGGVDLFGDPLLRLGQYYTVKPSTANSRSAVAALRPDECL